MSKTKLKSFEFIVDEVAAGVRLDKFLAEQFALVKPEITRSKVQNLLDENAVKIDGIITKNAAQKIKFGQKFEVEIMPAKPSHLIAKEIAFEIIFEDEDLLVINKPAGLTVHPGSGNQEDTLVNALLFTHKDQLSKIGGEFRLGIVHRLDKDTSGLMLVAKNDFVHQKLSDSLRNREIKRSYLAFIYGVVEPKKGIIDKNIVRSRVNRLKMQVARTSGREAITNYETLKIYGNNFASLVECRLQTGRTHQIRVHLESVKHSLIGDQVYNSAKKNLVQECQQEIKDRLKAFARQALHSYKISFVHPKTEEEMSFEIPFPQDLKELQQCLESL